MRMLSDTLGLLAARAFASSREVPRDQEAMLNHRTTKMLERYKTRRLSNDNGFFSFGKRDVKT